MHPVMGRECRRHLIVRTGDVMYDAALAYGEIAARRSGALSAYGLAPGGYLLATVHRAENTDDPARLRALFDGLGQASAKHPVVLPLHGKVPAHPQAKAPPPELLRTTFAEQDRDHDGVLRFAEFAEHHQTMLRAGFAAMDGNGDGGIDAGELTKATAGLPGQKPAFGEHDADGNGKVSWEEFSATHSRP